MSVFLDNTWLGEEQWIGRENKSVWKVKGVCEKCGKLFGTYSVGYEKPLLSFEGKEAWFLLTFPCSTCGTWGEFSRKRDYPK